MKQIHSLRLVSNGIVLSLRGQSPKQSHLKFKQEIASRSLPRFLAGLAMTFLTSLSLLKHITITLIRGYQMMSALMKPNCRFYPTCSQYSIDAVNRYGMLKGMWMGAARIFRCNQFNPGGYDPVYPNTKDFGAGIN